MEAAVLKIERPRNVKALQAAAILYGGWGTSKAYVIGLAFALAGYSSFWLIALMGVLNLLIGLNYITICRCYPDGGGVYASVRNRSEGLALLGGYAIIADYIITASLSALSACYYLGVPNPEMWALSVILIIGALNFLGPRHTGNLAAFIAIPAVFVVIILGVLCLLFFKDASQAIQPLEGDFVSIWRNFVGVVVGLSGVECIANATGLMPLDKMGIRKKPTVLQTARPAIISVMLEVVIFTTLLSFGTLALKGLTVVNDTVNAPGESDIRDYMLRYMGQELGSQLFGLEFGMVLSVIISIAFFTLLLSAVNTAVVALISLLFVLSKDSALPKSFQRLNQYGVPWIPLLIATVMPFFILLLVSDMEGLAELYAVGFVGAIAINLGATSTDRYLDLRWRERVFMFAAFVVMASIELTLLIDKPNARIFLFLTLLIGLFLRGLSLEPFPRKRIPPPSFTIASDVETPLTLRHERFLYDVESKPKEAQTRAGALLCVISEMGKSLEFAFTEAEKQSKHLYILCIKERKIIIESEEEEVKVEDDQAQQIIDYANKYATTASFTFLYAVTHAPAVNIAKTARELNIATIILGLPSYNPLVQMIRGDLLRELKSLIPPHVSLVRIS